MPGKTDDQWTTSLLLKSEDASSRLARALHDGFSAGDVVLMSGPIGAGKSHFSRSLIRAMLQDHEACEDIPSPTFTLVQTYDAGKLEIWHADLYRLTSVDEVFELGLIEAFETALCLVEWPDKLGAESPNNALHLSFELREDPDHRLLRASATGAKWSWLQSALKSFAKAENV